MRVQVCVSRGVFSNRLKRLPFPLLPLGRSPESLDNEGIAGALPCKGDIECWALAPSALRGTLHDVGAELLAVTFHFARDTGVVETEIHYMAELPVAGDLVSHGSEPWMVKSIESDPAGVVALCAGPLETSAPHEETVTVVQGL
jgi:hypothetical protein